MSSRATYWTSVRGRGGFGNIISQDPSISKSGELHVDIFQKKNY
jgi:hypothetical protein